MNVPSVLCGESEVEMGCALDIHGFVLPLIVRAPI